MHIPRSKRSAPFSETTDEAPLAPAAKLSTQVPGLPTRVDVRCSRNRALNEPGSRDWHRGDLEWLRDRKSALSIGFATAILKQREPLRSCLTTAGKPEMVSTCTVVATPGSGQGSTHSRLSVYLRNQEAPEPIVPNNKVPRVVDNAPQPLTSRASVCISRLPR